jgi:DNA-binding Lrp family transcriptional regulator
MDALDREIINLLQGGLDVTERPYLSAAKALGIEEDTLLRRISALLEAGVLSRFGPMYNADLMGGAFTLAAMAVPDDDFERAAALVNAHPEVAHNYEREHALNMWFVVATDRTERITEVLRTIEQETGYGILNLPKIDEYFVGLRLEVQ